MQQMIGQSIGNHRIVAELGHGGMGTVYKAEDTRLGRSVAIKILNPSLDTGPKELERFQSEAKVQARLNHPNIVTLHEFEPYGDSYCMIMEYVEGRTLAEIIRQVGPLPAHIVVLLSRQVLEGLSAAHRMGVVHRDLKPSNIMLTAEGVAKVMDFGIAKVQGGKKLTVTGAVVGTVYYMAPEQVRGEIVDSRSDLYSFGIILFEALTGRVPFKEESDFLIMIHHVQTPPPPPTQLLSDIPSALEDVVLRCLKKDPAERFQDAAEILAVLDGFEEQERALGNGQLYTRRALAQWLATRARADFAPADQVPTVLDGSPPRIVPPPNAATMPDAKPAPPVPPLPPIPAQAQPPVLRKAPGARPGKGLVLGIGVPVLLAAAIGLYFLAGRREIRPDSAVAQSQLAAVQAPPPVATAEHAAPAASAVAPQTPAASPPAERPVSPPPAAAAAQQSVAREPTSPNSPLQAGAGKAAATASATLPRDSARAAAARATPRPETRSSRAQATDVKPARSFVLFLDLDQSGEKLPLGSAQSRVGEIIREGGYEVASSGLVGSAVRSALDRGDLSDVSRRGVGYVAMGTVHGSVRPQSAYGNTFYVGEVRVSFEVVRASDGKVASTGSGSGKSRGMSSAEAALSDALMSAASDAARAMLRELQP